MKKLLARVLLRLHGWSISEPPKSDVRKCVVIACPHTSNWDFYFTLLAFYALDVPIRVTVKNTWVRAPFSWISVPLGAIGIKRQSNSADGRRQSYIDAMAAIIDERDKIALVITPEGSRSRRDEWKSGFYYLCLKANVPLCLGYLDYEKKIAGIGKYLQIGKNQNAEMQEIMRFYMDKAAKYPEKFALDRRYL